MGPLPGSACVTANTACSVKQGFAKGFDQFIDRKKMRRWDADKITDKALEFLANTDPDEPVFLWVHYLDPHWPYRPPRSFKDQPKAPKCRALTKRVNDDRDLAAGLVQSNHEGMAADAVEDCRALYDACVRFNDAEVGRLIAGLKQADRWSDALVVLTSDHGENMGEEGYYFGHGPSLSEGSLRVPLIIKGPGVPGNRIDTGLVSGIDVMPTMLHLLGIPSDEWPQMDGRDLSWRWDPSQEPPAHAVDYAYAESATVFHIEVDEFVASGRPGRRYCVHDERYSMCVDAKTRARNFHDRSSDPELLEPLAIDAIDLPTRRRLETASRAWPRGSARQRMVRTKEWKLVERPSFEGGFADSLYDLGEDPWATVDVRATGTTRAADMGDRLHRWLDDVPLFEAQEQAGEDLRELRALGYIGN